MGNPFYETEEPRVSWRRVLKTNPLFLHPSQPGLASVVSMAMGDTWPTWRAETNYHHVARFQQRQLQEKEQKLLHLLESQQQRALQRVSRGSAGSSSSSSSTNSNSSSQGGKVRLMFEEQRRNLGGSLPARRGGARSGPTTGYDRSYPLDPLSKTAPAGRLVAPRAPPQKPRVKPDNDISLRPGKGAPLARDTNANRLSPNDDLQTVFGKLANVGLRNGANNNLDDDNVVDAPRKPMVKSLAEPKIRPAPAKRAEAPRPAVAAATKPAPSLARRPTPPSPAKSSSSSSAASPEPRKPSSAASIRSVAASPAAKKENSGPVNQGPVPPGMAECSMCGRRFADDRISKHEDICRKTKTKKRKTFDPVKMRVQGTEVESYVKQAAKKSSTPAAKKIQEASNKKNNWRKKHEDFIEAIRNAKKVQQHIAAGGKASDLPAAKPMDTSDYIQCPHCSRKFSEGAAERHIPRCANIKSNKPAGKAAPPRKR